MLEIYNKELMRDCKVLRSEEHTSELQSRQYLVCRLLLEKKNRHPSRPTAIRYSVWHTRPPRPSGPQRSFPSLSPKPTRPNAPASRSFICALNNAPRPLLP